MTRLSSSYAPYPDDEDPLAVLGGYDALAAMPPPAPVDPMYEAPPIPEQVAPEPIATPPADLTQLPAPKAPAATTEPISAEPATEPDDEPSPLEALAQRYASMQLAPAAQPQRQAPQLPAPPMREGTPAWALIGGGVLDLLLNKGRNAGAFMATLAGQDDDVAYDNWSRQVEAAKAQSALDNAYAYNGRVPAGLSPEQVALQQQRIDLAKARLKDRENQTELTKNRDAAIQARWDEANKVGSPTHRAMVDYLVGKGIAKREEIEKLPASKLPKEAIADYMKNTGALGEAREQQAAETAGAVSAATLDDRIKVAKEGAIAREEAEGQSPAFQAQQEERYRAAADQYAKETDRYRGVAQQVQRSRTVLEKYKGGKDLPGLGVIDGRVPDAVYSAQGNTDALELRNAQRLMNDLVLRAQTGAAAPLTEQQQVQIMTGSKPGATEAEFMVGLQAMEEYANGQLRAFSAGKGDAARDVLRQQGIEDFVFPENKKQKANGKRKTAPAKPVDEKALGEELGL